MLVWTFYIFMERSPWKHFSLILKLDYESIQVRAKYQIFTLSFSCIDWLWSSDTTWRHKFVKYECDSKNLTGTIPRWTILLTEKFMNRDLLPPTPMPVKFLTFVSMQNGNFLKETFYIISFRILGGIRNLHWFVLWLVFPWCKFISWNSGDPLWPCQNLLPHFQVIMV